MKEETFRIKITSWIDLIAHKIGKNIVVYLYDTEKNEVAGKAEVLPIKDLIAGK